MRRVSQISGFIFWILFLFFICFFTWPFVITENTVPKIVSMSNIVPSQKVPLQNVQSTTTLLFVGDIMLTRGIESLIQENGVMYPFLYMQDQIESVDLAIGNFEGIVTDQYIPAPSMTFQFSVRSTYLETLKNVGFDILSLANNHSFDHGHSALTYTRSLCVQMNLVCGGSPYSIDDRSHYITEINGVRIGFLFMHTLYSTPDVETTKEILEILARNSDIQIAYIHWGDEYKLIHNYDQETFAHTLVELGVDTIIGHHPHVVQDVEIYNNVLIVYSLGNFVFDQYFSTDVMQGLALQLDITPETLSYTFSPIETYTNHGQPRLMDSDTSSLLIERIFPVEIDTNFTEKATRTITLQR